VVHSSQGCRGRVLYKAQTDAWKIVVADGIEGLPEPAGGPAGALVGLAAARSTLGEHAIN